MNTLRHLTHSPVRRAIRGACLAAALGAAAAGHAAPPDAAAAAAGQAPDQDARGPEHGGRGFHPDLPMGPMGPMRHLRSLDLTEAQQDKLFALTHAAAPQQREQDKAIRKAHDTLRALNEADRFDDAKAAAAARDLGQALGAQALAEARLHAQVLAVLTPEQRARLRQRRGPRGPEREGERGNERGRP